MKTWLLIASLALSAAAVKRDEDGGDCKPEDRKTTRVPFCGTLTCQPIGKICDPTPTAVVESKRTTVTKVNGCTTTLSVDWYPCPTCQTCFPSPPGPTSTTSASEKCKAEDRKTIRSPLCPTYSCAQITKTCEPGPTAVITSKLTTMTWAVDGCTTTLGVDWVPCSTCATCTPGRVSATASPPPKPSTTRRSASCFGDGKGRTKTEGACPSLFCANPTEDCSSKPTSVIKTITKTQTIIKDCTTTLRLEEQPCPTCNTCKPSGAACTGKGKTIRQDLCPVYKCAVPTSSCKPTKSTSTIKTITNTQTTVDDCTTTLRIGLQPCSTCKTCLDGPNPTAKPEDMLETDGKDWGKRDVAADCDSKVFTTVNVLDKCAAVRCRAPTKLCLPGEVPYTRTTRTIATSGCTVSMQTGLNPCCPTCTRRREGGPVRTLPVQPTLLPSKRAEEEGCDKKERTTIKTDKCAVVRCAAPTKECLVAEPPRTIATRTVTTEGCTVRLNVGFDKCCQTCTGGPTAVNTSPPKPTKPPTTPGYPPCRDTVTTVRNDLCPQVRCLPPTSVCSGELKTVTRTKKTETERVNPCTWALHTGWSPCAFCTPCEVPPALATANVFDEDKGLWVRVEGLWPTETPEA